ncbi:hypothetical protein ABT158_25945 [Nonomuraea sp. NPDC001636]|uniref:hypothetical protein n=1 Tax=Nonomuraea sp. NPDC001636 TaxID=3154391 RepID=UPI00331DE7B8
MGIARSALVVLAVGAVVTLAVVGVRALIGSSGSSGAQPERPASTAGSAVARASEGRAPTVRIENGSPRAPGEQGAREAFTARGPGG